MTARHLRLLVLPAGVLAGHSLGYLVAHPAGPERETALAGHGYLGLAQAASLIGAAVAGMAMVWLGSRRAAPRDLGASLAMEQATAFLVLELIEHQLTSGSAVTALGEPGVRWGLAAQVPVASLLALALKGLAATGRALVARLQPLPPGPVRRERAPAVDFTFRNFTLSPIRGRAPPVARPA